MGWWNWGAEAEEFRRKIDELNEIMMNGMGIIHEDSWSGALQAVAVDVEWEEV